MAAIGRAAPFCPCRRSWRPTPLRVPRRRSHNDQVLVSLIVFACVYGGAILGFAVRIPAINGIRLRRAQGRHRPGGNDGGPRPRPPRRLGQGLVRPSKGRAHPDCADVSLLDRVLANYGPEGATTGSVFDPRSRRGFSSSGRAARRRPRPEGEALYDAIDRLPVKTSSNTRSSRWRQSSRSSSGRRGG